MTNDELILEWIRTKPEDFERRVLLRLDGYPDDETCWRWTRCRTSRGYGKVGLPATLAKHKSVLTHRAVFIWYIGRVIAPGFGLDHDEPGHGCHDRSCANPHHLMVANQSRNTGNAFIRTM